MSGSAEVRVPLVYDCWVEAGKVAQFHRNGARRPIQSLCNEYDKRLMLVELPERQLAVEPECDG